ncbi:hypothetical protein J5751_05315 [bacterium]|nr:hypothetical protein [bacterium]
MVNQVVGSHNQLSNCSIKASLLLNDESMITSFTWLNLFKYVLWSNKALPARIGVASVPAQKCNVTTSFELKLEIFSCAALKIWFQSTNSYFQRPNLPVTFLVGA